MSSKTDDSLWFSSYLDSIRVLSNSEGTVKAYRSGLNHFKAFVEPKLQCQISEVITRIKNGNPDDVYRLLNEFVVYLYKLGKKPATIKVTFASAKGFLRHLYGDIKDLVNSYYPDYDDEPVMKSSVHLTSISESLDKVINEILQTQVVYRLPKSRQ